MRREILILLAISLVWGAVDQSYVHDVSRDGSSEMEKTSELSLFSDQIDEEAYQRMKIVCDDQEFRVDCSVDAEAKTVTITEKLVPGGYYAYSADYGFPFITYSMVIDKIPNDRFASALSRILVEANVTDPAGAGGSVNPIDFEDEINNREVARILKNIEANITYTVNFPVPVSEAKSGNASAKISGNSVTFDVVELLEVSEPVRIRSSEINLGYMVLIIGLIIVGALALSFFGSKPIRSAKKKKA